MSSITLKEAMEQLRLTIEKNEREGLTPRSIYACPDCDDTGIISWIGEDGYWYGRPCSCSSKTQFERAMKKAGIYELAKNYTFSNFKTDTADQKSMYDLAMKYLRAEPLPWFYIGGQPGSGKTHLCTAIVTELVSRGHRAKYVIWRDVTAELNAKLNTEEYGTVLDSIKTAEVLYIDDFFKGRVSDGDIHKAFEIINYRYNNNLPTIISSERSVYDITEIDEATGSRIYERSFGFMSTILSNPNKNYRMHR